MLAAQVLNVRPASAAPRSCTRIVAQRRIAAMEKAKFIKRLPRTSTANGSNPNLYDFSGLITAAEPFAREELQEIEQRKKASAEKLARKRPRLAVVNG